MRFLVDKEILRRNFSRCAHLYDRYADIQRLAADELINFSSLKPGVYQPRTKCLVSNNARHEVKLILSGHCLSAALRPRFSPRFARDFTGRECIKESSSCGFKDILEIGCGTGNYTRLLKREFKTARIKAIDLSRRMIEIARKKLYNKSIEFIVGDAETMNLDEKFGLITSNAALQWFEDIEKAIKRYKDNLIEDGMITFSLFGPLTFSELGQALKEVLNNNALLSAGNFLGREGLEAVLRRYFEKVDIIELTVKKEYISLMELLIKIKYTGARGNGTNGAWLWNKKMITDIEEIYRSRFGKIEATYQIFFCKAAK